ncbi:hypothetical protein SK128_020630 [Halocaridina rubra]|uniref:RING-type domain-containing protein n=1 Tax=Halocaridina rubra TaxID=373956 RepID=A0AAN9AF29_HALRR
MSSVDLKCGFCHECFDDKERSPRLLKCSHRLCHYCTDSLIKNDIKVCPYCHEEFEEKSSKEILADENILEHIRRNGKKRSLEHVPNSCSQPASKRIKRAMRNHIASSFKEAREHVERVTREITGLQNDIMQEKELIQREIFPEINKTLSQNDKYLNELKDIDTLLQHEMEQISSVIEQFSEDESLDDKWSDGIPPKEWIQNIKELVCKEEAVVESIQREVKKSERKSRSLLGVLVPQTEQGEISDSSGINTPKVKQENVLGTIKVESILNLNALMLSLVKEGKIYAVQERNGRIRYALLSVVEEHLCIHHLKDDPPLEKIFIVEYRDLCSMVSCDAREVFLQLRSIHSRKLLGTLIISLTKDSKRSENFWLICSGERGPSYANTRVMEVSGKGDEMEHVCLGDYEGKNGYGGKTVVPDAGNETGGILKRPWMAGVVTGEDCYGGDDTAAQFRIFTRSRPRSTLDLCFGRVESGLAAVVKAIARYPNIEDVYIDSCGIVLNTL